MPYQPNIPQPTDQISVSQDDILQNFQSIQPAFNQNHRDFNSGANIAGQHTFVQLNTQANWPAVGSFPGSVGIWANNAALPSPNNNAVMLHNAAGADINISAYYLDTANATTTVLPSGLMIKTGVATATGFNQGGIIQPFPNHILSVTVTPFNPQAAPLLFNATVYNINPVTFSVNCTNYAGTAGAAVRFGFIAIGY